jgi:ribosomal protein S27AE
MQPIKLLTVVMAFALDGISTVSAAAIDDKSQGKEQDLSSPNTRVRQTFEAGLLRANERGDVAAQSTTPVVFPHAGAPHNFSLTITYTEVVTQRAGPPVLVTLTQFPSGGKTITTEGSSISAPSTSPVGIGCVADKGGPFRVRVSNGNVKDDTFLCKERTVSVEAGVLVGSDHTLGYVDDSPMLVFSKSTEEVMRKSKDFSICGADQFLARNQDRQWWRCSQHAGTFVYFDVAQPGQNRTCQQVLLN